MPIDARSNFWSVVIDLDKVEFVVIEEDGRESNKAMKVSRSLARHVGCETYGSLSAKRAIVLIFSVRAICNRLNKLAGRQKIAISRTMLSAMIVLMRPFCWFMYQQVNNVQRSNSQLTLGVQSSPETCEQECVQSLATSATARMTQQRDAAINASQK